MPTKIPDSCDNCGACCLEQGSPPGYLGFEEFPPEYPDDPDMIQLVNMSAPARAALDEYKTNLLAGLFDGEGPCCWFDLSTRKCRFYNERPEICREFEVGGEGCQTWRNLYQIGESK